MLTGKNGERESVERFSRAFRIAEAELFHADGLVGRKGERGGWRNSFRLGIEDFKEALTGVLVSFEMFDGGWQREQWLKGGHDCEGDNGE